MRGPPPAGPGSPTAPRPTSGPTEIAAGHGFASAPGSNPPAPSAAPTAHAPSPTARDMAQTPPARRSHGRRTGVTTPAPRRTTSSASGFCAGSSAPGPTLRSAFGGVDRFAGTALRGQESPQAAAQRRPLAGFHGREDRGERLRSARGHFVQDLPAAPREDELHLTSPVRMQQPLQQTGRLQPVAQPTGGRRPYVHALRQSGEIEPRFRLQDPKRSQLVR